MKIEIVSLYFIDEIQHVECLNRFHPVLIETTCAKIFEVFICLANRHVDIN